MNDEKMIILAIRESEKCVVTDDVPVGCIIAKNGEIVSKAHNLRNRSNITIDHAEILAITSANKRLNSWRLDDCKMYVTLEPCDMCKNVIKEARITEIYYLLPRNKSKFQFSKSNFIQLDFTEKRIHDYEQKLKSFFINKR